MSNKILITGPPRSGKTTLIKKVMSQLESAGFQAGGIYCPELRSGGDRVGFEIVDVMTGERAVLAHTERNTGPRVGKYRVNVNNIDAISASAFARAFEEADFVVIDEIAPMEVNSVDFKRGVRQALQVDQPLIAAIQYRSSSGFIGEIKDHDMTEQLELTDSNREGLTERLTDRLKKTLSP